MEFKAFLSHRYKSPEVNLYFHQLFYEVAKVHFDVDIGPTPTNVTRLERMIRESDAFIGIYPFPGDPQEKVSFSELLLTSKYFRLELDLAVRSGKPTVIFFDERYSQVLTFPRSLLAEPFDIQEVTGRGGSPKRNRFRRVIEDFIDEVSAYMAAAVSMPLDTKQSSVGLILPTAGPDAYKYNGTHVDTIKNVLGEHGIYRVKHLKWPPALDGEYFAEIEELDWVVIDIGETAMNSGIVGYLHGRFVPMLRLLKGYDFVEQVEKRESYRGLYGGLEVGYLKDIVAWNDLESLKRELNIRLATLFEPVERISTKSEGEEYFRRASLMKETVFLSYSGKDAAFAFKLSSELKKRFQVVFDYRDGESITPGEPWLKEIFDKLSTSAIGIPLVSSSYLASGNCIHEAQEMVARRDMNEMAMIPVKLYEEEFELPSWMRNRQYLHAYDYPDIKTTVDKLVNFFEHVTRK